MKKHFTSLIILVILMGCSKPISNSKFTNPFTLQKNLFINHVTFNNLAFQTFKLDEDKIEKKLLQPLEKQQKSLAKKPTKLTINLLEIEEQSIQKTSAFNIHNVVAFTAMLATRGVIADTSSIDSNQIKNSKFILNLTSKEETTKLFIEISNYSDKEELKKLFEAELIHKIEEILDEV